MGKGSPRRMSPELRKQHLIDSALVLFAQRPPEQVSMDDIAEQAQVSRALVYRYFPSTEAIHVAALKAAADDLIARFTLSRKGELLEQLAASLADFVDFATDYAPTYVALLRTGSVVSTRDRNDLIGLVRQHALAEILDRAGIREPRPLLTLAIQCWIAVAEGATLSWLEEKFCTRDELVTWLVNQFTAMTAVSAQ